MTHADAARDNASLLGRKPFWAYLTAVALVGNFALVFAALSMSQVEYLALAASPAFWAVMALIVLGEVRPILTGGSNDPVGVATSTTFTFASLLVFGLPVAAALQALATVITGVVRRKAWWRTLFNIGQYTLSLAAGWAVLALSGVHADPSRVSVPAGLDLLAVALAAVVYFAVNNGFVWIAISLTEQRPVLGVVREEIGYQLLVNSALLGLAPLVTVVIAHAWEMLPLFLLPLLAVYKYAAMSCEREKQALLDPLTGLPNRAALVAHTQEALRFARRGSSTVAVMLLDLDRFKEVNDTLGHPVGDRALTEVATRLQGHLRDGDIVARLGGDEFAVLLPDVADASAACEVASRLREALARPMELEGTAVTLDASVGIALHPRHGTDFDELFRGADVAMYLAKAERTGVEVYTAERDVNSPHRLGLLGELRAGMERGELELHFQPKITLDNDQVSGVESLVRWRHPARGLVPPDDFIPLAEESGLMPRLTDLVLTAALEQAAGWWRDGLCVPMAVNVSVRDLQDAGFAGRLAQRLAGHGLPPSALLLEITERVLMSDATVLSETIAELGRLGIGLSLDDFGTGYSSLAQLQRLPVGELKIDRSFVSRLADSQEDAAIVRSMIELGHALGMVVVAEGVEAEPVLRQLQLLGCDVAQGYLVSRPMPAAAATCWLTARRKIFAAPLA
jgi:diguanylate cyclase (GGDEF)-like protein